MTGQCCPTQTFNYKLLRKMGLEAIPFNTAECIGDIPMSEEDLNRMRNGWNSTALHHSVLATQIPIKDKNGITQNYPFVLDPTFRQFCIKENCEHSIFTDENNRIKRVAPHPGYFIQKENLIKLGVPKEDAIEIEKLGRRIISKGYFYLSEKNAKIYGDTFVRASKRIEFQDLPINKTGEDYIRNLKENPMEVLDFINKNENSFVKLPSEIIKEKQGFFTRVMDWCTKIGRFFNRNGNDDLKKLETAKPVLGIRENDAVWSLTEEELMRVQEGTNKVLCNRNDGLHKEPEGEQNEEKTT